MEFKGLGWDSFTVLTALSNTEGHPLNYNSIKISIKELTSQTEIQEFERTV